jgi:hypothetical protein
MQIIYTNLVLICFNFDVPLCFSCGMRHTKLQHLGNQTSPFKLMFSHYLGNPNSKHENAMLWVGSTLSNLYFLEDTMEWQIFVKLTTCLSGKLKHNSTPWPIIEHKSRHVVIAIVIWPIYLKRSQNSKCNNTKTCCDVNFFMFLSPCPKCHCICIVEYLHCWEHNKCYNILHFDCKFCSSECSLSPITPSSHFESQIHFHDNDYHNNVHQCWERVMVKTQCEVGIWNFC